MGDEGLYRIVIKAITKSPIFLKDTEEVCIATWTDSLELRGHNLAKSVSKDTTAKLDLWYMLLGHLGMTVFYRMLLLTVGRNLNSSDAHKTHECIICIHKNSIKNHPNGNFPHNYFHLCIESMVMYVVLSIPQSGAFWYIFVLIDALSSYLEVSLLSTRNMIFPNLLAIFIRYRNHFPNYSIKYLRMDNA